VGGWGGYVGGQGIGYVIVEDFSRGGAGNGTALQRGLMELAGGSGMTFRSSGIVAGKIE
jgi:hypothetical protein